jgi:hypothetical protein
MIYKYNDEEVYSKYEERKEREVFKTTKQLVFRQTQSPKHFILSNNKSLRSQQSKTVTVILKLNPENEEIILKHVSEIQFQHSFNSMSIERRSTHARVEGMAL